MSRRLGEPAFHYAQVDTTMRLAAQHGREGCPHGTIVTADSQSDGRGRQAGRIWQSEPGLGLYLSLVLRPTCRPDQFPILGLVAGLAAKDAVQRIAGVACDLRWPNDVLIRERKCCGILAELFAESAGAWFVVVGIGINLNHTQFAQEIADTATSLRIETGRDWARESMLEILLESLECCYDLFVSRGPEPILAAFQQASSYVFGRQVVIEGVPDDVPGPVRGVTAGLSASGELLLRTEDGALSPVRAGSVRADRGTM